MNQETLLKNSWTSWIMWIISASSVAFTLLVITPNYWIDDSFIGFRYARNLSDGFGLVFNPGERIEGYTSFLWVIFSYLGVESGAPMFFLQCIGVVSQVALLWLVFGLGKSVGRAPYQALVAPLFLAFHVTFLVYPMTGMDTVFFTLLITVAVFLFIREQHKTGLGSVLTGLVLLTIALTRFDGLVIVSIMLSFKILIDRELKELIKPILIFVIGIGLYNLWRISYYPTLLPNTFYAKVDLIDMQLAGGVRYLFTFFVKGWPFLIPMAVVPFILKKANRLTMFIGWIAFWHLMYVLYVGGDWMPFFRFMLPVLPLLFLLVQEGVWALHERFDFRLRIPSPRIAATACLVGLLFSLHMLTLYRARDFTRYITGKVFNPQEGRLVGQHLSKSLPADYVVAIEWAGIVPYYLRQPVLDILGLNDRDITLQDFPSARMGRAITLDYLIGRDPEAILVSAKTFPSAEKAAKGVELRVQAATPDNWMRDFYSKLITPEFGYRVCVMRIDEEHYYPVLIRHDLEHTRFGCLHKDHNRQI